MRRTSSVLVLMALVAWSISGSAAQAVLDGNRLASIQRAPQANARTSAPTEPPDLSGVWRVTNATYLTDLAAAGSQFQFQPWGRTLLSERQRRPSMQGPASRCLPRGLPGDLVNRSQPWKLVQTPGVVVMLFGELLHYRQIFTDGRGLPEVEKPTWFGYSVGHWDGATLVVESTGFNEDTWLDDGGRPHSSEMRITERFQRTGRDRLRLDVMIDDPKALVMPWRGSMTFQRLANEALIERVCPVS